MDEKEAEFNILVQRTKQRIALSERLGESIRLLSRSEDSQRVSKRQIVARKLRDLGKNIHFSADFDKKLSDPVWETALKIQNMDPS